MGRSTVTAQSETRTALEDDRSQALSGLDYQAFWTTSGSEDWLGQALGEVASWARERLGLEVDLTEDGEAQNSDQNTRIQVLHRQAGRDAGVRLRAWNTNAGTTFVITVLAVNGPSGGWLLAQASSTDRSRRTEKPRVVDRILSVVDLTDVEPMRTAAQHVTHTKLDDLEELINHPARRFPVIVAAPVDGVDFDRWLKAVSKWTRYCAGIAHVMSLDPYSATEFTRRHNRRGVYPATLRTYPPGADLADPAVEQTARWLTPKVLAGSETKVARTIESFVRQYQVTHSSPLPPAVREWSRAFDRFAAQKLRSALSPVAAPLEERVAARQAALKPEVQTTSTLVQLEDLAAEHVQISFDLDVQADLQETIASLQVRLTNSENARVKASIQLLHIQEYLSLPNLEDASLLELLDAATQTQPNSSAIDQIINENDELQTKVEELEDSLINEQLNYSDLRTEHDRLEVYYKAQSRENSFLRSKVVEHDPASAYSWVDNGGPVNPLGECPTTWDALLSDSRLADNGLVFTGNQRRIKEVVSLDLAGVGLQAAWDALGTLASYRGCRLGGTWDASVHSFCEAGPLEAFRVPPSKHAQDETGATRKDSRLAGYRLLPVPESVDSTGHVYMWTHFKPHSWSAHQKLRIHYYDQVMMDGNIYLGHVGHHLPSGSTDKVHR
jgi:hypothetical protein